jgi:hypothetical protein
MTDFAGDCPHCNSQKIAFTPRGAYGHSQYIFIFLECRCCHVPVTGRFFAISHNWVINHNGDERINFDVLKFMEFIKTSKNTEIPEHLSDNVAKSYLQALDNIKRQNWIAAGIMFRRTLERAVKELNEKADGMLKSKIDQLGDQHGITQSMKDWAHQVRIIGNDAAHEEEDIDEKDAKDAWNFTESFLTYSFSLPKKIEKRREEIEQLSKK